MHWWSASRRATGLELDVVFVSAIPRQTLKRQQTRAKLLTPIFPHIQLQGSSKIQVDFLKFSQTKWQIIRQYYLRVDGIIDKFLHDLKNLNEQSSHQEIRKVVRTLRSFHAILPPEIVDFLRQVEGTVAISPSRRKLRRRNSCCCGWQKQKRQ